MEDHTARSLAGELGRHPASTNGALISQLSGIVSGVIAARVPDRATAAIALDEADEPVVVAVSEEGVIRLKALGDSSDDFHLTSELLRFDGPGAKTSVEEVALGDNSGGLFVKRAWLYELSQPAGHDRPELKPGRRAPRACARLGSGLASRLRIGFELDVCALASAAKPGPKRPDRRRAAFRARVLRPGRA